MKTTTPKKKDDTTIVVPAPKVRMPRIPQRGATFKSGKDYKRDKRVRED
jgi:hypothetical protein